MEKKKIFTEGMIFKGRPQGAPDFVLGTISIKVDEFINFLRQYSNDGWVNIDVKKSQKGKTYGELNTFKKKETVKYNAPENVSTLSEEEQEFIRNMRQSAKKNFEPDEINASEIGF